MISYVVILDIFVIYKGKNLFYIVNVYEMCWRKIFSFFFLSIVINYGFFKFF